MTTPPSATHSQKVRHGGADTKQEPQPEVWELLDRDDVQTFLAFERHCAYSDGKRDGVNQEYQRWQNIPLAAYSYAQGWHACREQYERTGKLPHHLRAVS